MNLDIDSIYELILNCKDFDYLISLFQEIKQKDKKKFIEYIDKIKVLFVVSNEYKFLSTASLLFSKLKIHSSAHLIVAKLLEGQFDQNGGTFLYSLTSLKRKSFEDELKSLWNREISWEMEQMLDLLKIDQEA